MIYGHLHLVTKTIVGGGTSSSIVVTATIPPSSITSVVAPPTKTTTNIGSAPSPTGESRERIATFTKDMSPGQFFVILAGLALRGNVVIDLLADKEISFYALLANIRDSDALVLSKLPVLSGIELNGHGHLDELDLDEGLSTA